jgi:MoaA/NifB/PqqE/SkfB family radical SAM enzyme
MEIAVIVPALNEEESIPHVIAGVPEDLVSKVIVVDNGSSDRTADAARMAGARVVGEERRGYGYACAAGVAVAGDEPDVLVFLDGDGSDDASQIRALLGPIERGDADLVLGSRVLDSRAEGVLLPHQRLGNAIVISLVRLLYGQRITDLPPFKAIRRPVLADLDMCEMTYGWTVEMIVKCAKRGYRIVELPANSRLRIGGQSKVSGTVKGTVAAAYHLMATTLKYVRGYGTPIRNPVAKELPRDLYVEVTNRCNSRCKTCIRTFVTQEPIRDMTLAEFQHIVDQFPVLERVVLHGIGEPLLNSELVPMIRYVKEQHPSSSVLFNSNAILLSEECQHWLIDAGLDELRVSLDAATGPTYSSIRGLDAFDTVVDNLRHFSRLLRHSEGPRLSLWATATRQNLGELPDLVDLAAELGIQEVHLQRLVLFDRGLARPEQSLYGSVGTLAEEALAEATERARTHGVSLSASGLKSPQESLREKSRDLKPWSECYRPWTTTYVTANGNVLPCCISPFATTDYANLILGNVFDTAFDKIWSSAAYIDRRAAMQSERPFDPCDRCGVYWSL